MGWSEWRAADRAACALERARRRIALDLESIELDQDACYVSMLAENPRYRRAVDLFLDRRGLRKDARGWETACGSDRGLWRRTRVLSVRCWPRFWRILLDSRRARGGCGRTRCGTGSAAVTSPRETQSQDRKDCRKEQDHGQA